MEYIVVLITAPDEDEAVNIAGKLVTEKLAMCVNIVRDVRSFYEWEGKLEDDNEFLLIVKTLKESFRKLSERVTEMHSYSVPEIVALPIVDGSRDYLDWLGALKGK